MAFEQPLLEAIFSAPAILNNPGEDREIDMQLLKRGIKMEFLDDAYVLDEKVSSAAVFEKQRVRWLEAQVSHVRRFFDKDMRRMPDKVGYYVKLLQNLLLPRILTIFLFGLILIVLFAQWLFQGDWWRPSPGWWLICMALYAASLLISVPAPFYSKSTLRALGHVPVLLLSMLKALSKMKKGRKEFLHTPKTFTPD
jgi:cellulose synthase/poly-beta-1,6-N-acetylglucosamine synthase-like glycosyltransferase